MARWATISSGVAKLPRISWAGSPGANWNMMNVSRLTPIKTGMAKSARRRMKSSMFLNEGPVGGGLCHPPGSGYHSPPGVYWLASVASLKKAAQDARLAGFAR